MLGEDITSIQYTQLSKLVGEDPFALMFSALVSSIVVLEKTYTIAWEAVGVSFFSLTYQNYSAHSVMRR